MRSSPSQQHLVYLNGSAPGPAAEDVVLVAEEAKPLLPRQSSTQTKAKLVQSLRLAGVCCCWLAASSGIILVNRRIMKELRFSYPMALSAWGMGCSSLCAWFLCDVLKWVPPSGIDSRYFWTRVAPVGAAQGVAVWLSNNLYLLLTVAFIEMARAMLPLITLLALWLAAVEVPTRQHILAVSLTGLGCAISAYGEVQLSGLGLLCLAGNFSIEAGRLVLLQFLMQGRNLDPWQSLKLMSFPATVMLCVMSAALEARHMAAHHAGSIILRYPVEFLAAGTLGLLVNFLSNQVIKTSSATTIKLLAAVRGPLIVVAGVMLLAEQVQLIQLLGYFVALAGFVWYNIAKANTPRATSPAQPPLATAMAMGRLSRSGGAAA